MLINSLLIIHVKLNHDFVTYFERVNNMLLSGKMRKKSITLMYTNYYFLNLEYAFLLMFKFINLKIMEKSLRSSKYNYVMNLRSLTF